MCCFSGPVHVAKTRIFARGTAGGRQMLAYQMTFSTAADVAMILPLPVPAGTAEDGVRFIDLEGYPELFADLAQGFPDGSIGKGKHGLTAKDERAASLEVVEVGSFEASFVPTLKDFGRLDARFRLPEATWDKLPDYKSYGFAVFKLKKGAHSVHPMAFEFPRADPGRLFFPTVHIHDGRVHAEAHFDHALYCQLAAEVDASPSRPKGFAELWEESMLLSGQILPVSRTLGVVEAGTHCYHRKLLGKLPNRDTWA